MHVYMCVKCPLVNMVPRIAFAHSDKTGHRVVIQTPEAIMEQPGRLPRDKRDLIVGRVEYRLRSYIIGPECAEDCRCTRCWLEFQNRWTKGA